MKNKELITKAVKTRNKIKWITIVNVLFSMTGIVSFIVAIVSVAFAINWASVYIALICLPIGLFFGIWKARIHDRVKRDQAEFRKSRDFSKKLTNIKRL